MSTSSLDNKSIFIIGRGFIGSELKSRLKNVSLYSHDEDWASDARQENPNLIINAAGIVGNKKCHVAGKTATFDANVDFALRVAEVAADIKAHALLFSTGAVYGMPHSTPKRETDRLDPCNLYIESKIEMEQKTEGLDVIVFRIPVVIGSGHYSQDYLNRIRTWAWAQSCYISLLYMETLVAAIEHIIQHKVSGIFNIADYEFHYLPNFVQRHYKELPVRDSEHIPQGFTQTHLLDTDRARVAGVLK